MNLYRKIYIVIFAAVLIFAGFGPSVGAASKSAVNKNGRAVKKQAAAYIRGELLVKFKDGVTRSRQADKHRRFGAKKLKGFSTIHVDHVKLPADITVEEAINLYNSDPDVEYAEPNYIVSAEEFIPNDPLFDTMWDLRNTGQTGGTAGADMDTANAWDLTTGNSDLVVAVIDTGIDYNHEDLVGNIWTNTGEIPSNGIDDDGNGYVDDVHGWDATTCAEFGLFDCISYKAADGDPIDDSGHGTHCAGTIGADGNNGIGVAGINWDVQTMACKFITAQGWGLISDAISCLDYVGTMKDQGVNIVATSNSWGGGGYSQAMYDAVQAQMEKDILFIAAAGNSADDNDTFNHWPSNFNVPNVIAVAATDHNDEMTWFSSYGDHTVHVGAPGLNIISLRAAGTDLYGDGLHFIPDGDPNAKYYRMSGTSMATPHVSGLAALIKSQDMMRDWADIKNLILTGGTNTAAMKYASISGKRINAYGSLTCVDSPVFSALEYPAVPEAGVPSVLSALSINCEQPIGPVSVNVPGGAIDLYDDGIAPDMAAGDGVFSAAWTPSETVGSLQFSSPLGTDDPLFVISTSGLPAASTRTLYSETLQAQGGVEPYSWVISSGTLPIGLTLNSATGEISGTPTEIGDFSFSVILTDANSSETGQVFSLTTRDDRVLELWREVYDSYDASPVDITVDDAGNVYVTGWVFIDYLRKHDFLTLKLDSAGNVLWERIYDSGDSDDPVGIAVDVDGNVYVAGSDLNGSNYDYLTLKYGSTGDLLWARTYDSGSSDRATDMTVDMVGNIYVAGVVSDSNLTIKYDSDGNTLWEKVLDGGIGGSADSIAVDGAGNIFLAGTSSVNGSVYDDDYFTAKYDAAGNLLWNKFFNNMKYDRAHGIEVDGSGNIYVAGSSGDIGISDYLTVKYDTAGNLLWSRVYDTGGQDSVTGLALDIDGNVYVAGYYDDVDGFDHLILKYDASGNLIWPKFGDNLSAEQIFGIAVDNQGSIYLAGYFTEGTGSFVDYFMFVNKFKVLLGIASTELPYATTGSDYSHNLLVDGGLKPYNYSITAGTLPDGLTLDNITGEISGVASTTGVYNFTVMVSDANADTDSKALSISVYEPVAITTQSLPDGVVGNPYNGLLTASGGLPPYTWVIASGSLPDGLALDPATGAISGVPTGMGSFAFTPEVTDANGDLVNGGFTINISSTTRYYVQTASGCAAKTYKSGPRSATVSATGSDCANGDTVSWTFNGGPNDMLIGYLANGGYLENIAVTGEAAGSDLSFLAHGSGGMAYVSLVEVNPADGAVIQTLATISTPLSPEVTAHVTDISALSGTIQAGNSFGIMLSMDSVSRDNNEVRWGNINGGAGNEQWFTVMQQPASGSDASPVADAGQDQAAITNNLVSFDGSGSTDDKGITLYEWDFESDGIFDATGINATHVYAVAGTYTVTLRVTDTTGQTDTDTAVVTVDDPGTTPVIDTAVCAGAGALTITGSNFGPYTAGTSEVTFLETVCTGKGKNKVCNDVTTGCAVSSWTDIEILSDCGSCPSDIDINTTNGLASSPVT